RPRDAGGALFGRHGPCRGGGAASGRNVRRRSRPARRRRRRGGVDFVLLSDVGGMAFRASIPPQSVISCRLPARGVWRARRGALASKSMIHRFFFGAAVAFADLVIATAGAQAHPHIWVTVKSELVYAPDGTVTGVRHAWTFDDMFSVFATQGIESKTKGEIHREEVAALEDSNVNCLNV